MANPRSFAVSPLGAALVALSIAAAGHAQDLARYLPKDAQFVLVCDGPARFAERFAATNLMKLLGDPDAAPIRALPVKLRDLLDQAAKDEELPIEVGALLDRFAGYGGRFAVGAHLDLAAARESGMPRFFLAFVAEGHESVDFASVADDVKRAAESSDDALQPLDIGPGFLAAVDEDGTGATVPRVLDGHLVMFAGTDLAATLGQAFDGDAMLGASLPESVGESGFWLRADPGALVELVVFAENVQGARQRPSSAPSPETLGAILDRLALRDFEMALVPAGEFIRGSGVLNADASKPNAIDLFQPREAATPLLALVPAGHGNAQSFRFDVGELFDLVCDIVELEQDGARGMIEGGAREALDIDLHKDLLGALDGQLLVMNDSLANFEGLEPGAGPEDLEEVKGLYTFVIGLRDPTSFEAMLERVLRSRGLHAARKTAEYRGTKVRSMSVVVIQLHYAFVAEGVVVGVGPTGADNVRKVVDQSLARAEGQAPAALDEVLQKRVAALASGWRDLGTSNANVSANALLQALRMGFLDEEFDGDAKLKSLRDSFLAAADAWIPLAKRFDLLASVMSLRVEAGRLRFESIQ